MGPIDNPQKPTIFSPIFKDIAYASQSKSQNLDIYLPANGTGLYPVIVWMHPGGFKAGDKDGSASIPLSVVDIPNLFQPMLARGYAVVSINYRLSQEAIFPAVIYDVKAVIRWIRANAARYGFHVNKIATWGSSSGGYLAAMMATTTGIRQLEDLSMGNSEYSSQITAAVDWYGPTDFLLLDTHHEQLGQPIRAHSASSPESMCMGAPINTIPEKCNAASPLHYVNQGNSPIYIQHGKGDLGIPYMQSMILAERMTEVIGKDNVKFDLIEGVGHGDRVFFSQQNINKVLDFLDKHMK
jgi:acetyl esterase/lipase